MADTHIDNDPDIQSALPEGQTPPPRAGDGSEKPDLVPKINFDTGAALDDLLKQSTDDTEKKAVDEAKAKTEAEKKAADEKAKADTEAKSKAEAEKKAADEKARIEADPKLKAEAEAKAKAAADKKTADEKAQADAEKKIFGDIQLSPQASPKTGEAFAKVKERALQRIKERDEQIVAQTEKLSKVESDLATARKELEKRPTVDSNVEKELTDLRNWRKQIDVESDPKWKEFDTKVVRNQDAILTKLGKYGMSKDKLDVIRTERFNIDWEPILSKLPSQDRRFIEAKLVENESLDADKQDAIKTAKSKADEFLKERASTSEAQVKEAMKVEQGVVNHFLEQLPWSKKQEVKADAPAEQKSLIEAANKFADETQARLKTFMEDRSPNTRAQLVVGTLLAYKLTAQLEAKEKEVTAMKEAHESELKKIKDELAAASEELDRVKKASGAGRKPSSAPAIHKPTTNLLIRPGADALDQLRSEVQAE